MADSTPISKSSGSSEENNVSSEPVEISIILPTNAYFLSGIRDFTLTMTKNMTGFSDQWSFRFQSVVDELCNNAIEHGSASGEQIKITFVSYPNKSLEVSVEDSGTGPNKFSANQMLELFHEQKQKVQTQFLGLRGRGLAKIVSEWTDEIIFEDSSDGGLIVRVRKFMGDDEKSVGSSSASVSAVSAAAKPVNQPVVTAPPVAPIAPVSVAPVVSQPQVISPIQTIPVQQPIMQQPIVQQPVMAGVPMVQPSMSVPLGNGVNSATIVPMSAPMPAPIITPMPPQA
jgi:anti-sigma regulatory factor (Ser/Thr protein kinase)